MRRMHGNLPFIHRPGGRNLDYGLANALNLREITLPADKALGAELPVNEESGLKFGSGRAVNADVGVAPLAAAYAL